MRKSFFIKNVFFVLPVNQS